MFKRVKYAILKTVSLFKTTVFFKETTVFFLKTTASSKETIVLRKPILILGFNTVVFAQKTTVFKPLYLFFFLKQLFEEKKQLYFFLNSNSNASQKRLQFKIMCRLANTKRPLFSSRKPTDVFNLLFKEEK